MKFILFMVLFVSTGVNHLWGASRFLDRFSKDPKAASQELPEKSGASFELHFSKPDIKHRQFITTKDELRKKILCDESQPGGICRNSVRNDNTTFEAFNEDWQIRYFVSGPFEKNIFKLTHLNEGSAEQIPWAGYYWPTYLGGIGTRYADAQFPRSRNFKTNYDYYQNVYLRSPQATPESLSILAPSEKYDYLMGDSQWNLTRAAWKDGKTYLERTGSVETWMGICHGWAPAAIMLPEPTHTVDLFLPQRGTLRVYPHDVKALVSQLWASARFNTEFIGGRCESRDPATDENGRLIDPSCFDMNPSAWHFALTHQLGKNHKSFILDVTYDYEVWNQPIYSYKLNYFNPMTKAEGAMESSIVRVSDFTNDPFRKYRSPLVSYLVGVISEIQYVVESAPRAENGGSDPARHLVTVSYYYDLELDTNYNILGGEWYQAAHPDMLWRPANGAIAQFSGETQHPQWEGYFPVPSSLFNIGVNASTQKTPLQKILSHLVKWSL